MTVVQHQHHHQHHHHPHAHHSHTHSSHRQSSSSTTQHQQQQTSSSSNSRRVVYKKTPKRRKSLPSQCSSSDEVHPSVPLIPRGPLICYNSESLDNWLPDRSIFNQACNANSGFLASAIGASGASQTSVSNDPSTTSGTDVRRNLYHNIRISINKFIDIAENQLI